MGGSTRSKIRLNIKDYISSGILELYVLGQTSAKESKKVEEHVSLYLEIEIELKAAQHTFLSFNQLTATVPPAHLEQKILDKIGKKKTAQTVLDNDSSTGIFFSINPYLWLVLLTLALAGMGYFYQKSKANKTGLAACQSKFSKLKKYCEATQENIAKQHKYIAVVGDTDNQAVLMKGQEIAPEALAVVNWNPINRTAFLDIKNLSDPPQGKQYQLWAIVDGQPTDMGIFNIERGEMNLQTLPFIAAPQAFAVTLEKEGGSAVPTLDQIIMIGNI